MHTASVSRLSNRRSLSHQILHDTCETECADLMSPILSPNTHRHTTIHNVHIKMRCYDLLSLYRSFCHQYYWMCVSALACGCVWFWECGTLSLQEMEGGRLFLKSSCQQRGLFWTAGDFRAGDRVEGSTPSAAAPSGCF